MKKVQLSIVMPFYNEGMQTQITIDDAFKKLQKSGINFEFILVDNGSVDQTSEIIKKSSKNHKRIKYIRIEENKGYGFGVRSGLSKAQGEIIGWTDGDGQFDMSAVVDAYFKLKSGNYGLCKGRRRTRGDSYLRKIASLAFNVVFNLFYFNIIADINSKPKLMTKRCYNSFKIESNDWFIDAEVLIKTLRSKYKVTDIPLTFSARKSGKSNVKFKTIFEFFINLIKFRI